MILEFEHTVRNWNLTSKLGVEWMLAISEYTRFSGRRVDVLTQLCDKCYNSIEWGLE